MYVVKKKHHKMHLLIVLQYMNWMHAETTIVKETTFSQ